MNFSNCRYTNTKVTSTIIYIVKFDLLKREIRKMLMIKSCTLIEDLYKKPKIALFRFTLFNMTFTRNIN